MKLITTTMIFLAAACTARAQKWNIENTPGTSKKVTITTTEGTWMNLDVSPDGKTIAFDLLGDIYTIPVGGGKATLLAGGKAWEVQPRFSPDSKSISYTSDKEGGDNIWVMNADGGGKRSITKESFRLLNNASWTPDGQYLVARKHFTGSRSLGAGEMWLYHKNGGDGIQLTKRKNDQQDAGEPIVSPDGKYVYWSEDVTPGPSFEYNKDPYQGIYAIQRLNRLTGDIETVTGDGGGACRPQISPDGKLMAFVKRIKLKSVLYLHSFETGEEWPVYDDLSHDQQETWAIFGVYPNFNWTPDNQHLIFYSKGKIWNLDINSLSSVQVPFEVTSNQTITDALHFPQRVFQEEFTAKMIRQLTTSPDGKMVAFNAAGYVYVKDLTKPDAPMRVDTTKDFQYEPSFSPDGKSLVYITWNDIIKGSINTVDITTKFVTKLTAEKGFYYSPRYSNKGDKIIYRKGEGNDQLGYSFGTNPGIYTIPVTGGVPTLILNNGIKPQFSADDSKIYYQSGEGGKKAYKVMDANGTRQRTLYTSTYATQFAPSPDGKWMAFTELFNCYVTPMVNTGAVVDLSSGNKSLPLTKLTRDAGTYLHWNKDSQKLMWTLGPKYYTRDIRNAFSFIDGADKAPAADTAGVDIGLKLKSDVPTGTIAFTNARIITMKGDEVIEKGTIVIEGNKIFSIGKDGETQIPANAKIIDINGKTIMPGIVDVHAHLRVSPDGVTPQQDWGYYANLSYGVTTAHDPSSNTEMVFSQSEMLKTGAMVGPRVYSTGSILYGADGDFKVVINNLEDAISALRRLKAVGAFSVKSYNQPRREQRQQIIEAARQLQMEVVPEGGSSFFTNMNMIMDGHTGIEHNIPVWPIYKDVKSFWNESKTAYTPTLIVSYGGMFGENFWYARNDVWKDEHLLAFTPPHLIDARARRRITAEYGDYSHVEVSKAVKQISAGGTKVNLGAHGQLQGLGAHWEMWMLAQGGMTPLQVIRCATINGAAYLGMDKEIGSLERGKLADLIVLNQNPLDDIRTTDNIKYVMINGRMYDSDTMNETGNQNKIRLRFWWQSSRGDGVVLPVNNTETYLYTVENCD